MGGGCFLLQSHDPLVGSAGHLTGGAAGEGVKKQMNSTATRQLDTAIVTEIRRRGWADARITVQRRSETFQEEIGDWFVLSAEYRDFDNWQIIGRRRTRGELLTLIRGRTKETLAIWPPIEYRKARKVPRRAETAVDYLHTGQDASTTPASPAGAT